MLSDRSQANLLGVLLLVALHKRERAESEHFFAPWAGASVTSVPARDLPRRQRQFRRQQAAQIASLSRCEVQ